MQGWPAPDQVGSGTNRNQTQAARDGIKTEIGHTAGSEMQGMYVFGYILSCLWWIFVTN